MVRSFRPVFHGKFPQVPTPPGMSAARPKVTFAAGSNGWDLFVKSYITSVISCMFKYVFNGYAVWNWYYIPTFYHKSSNSIISRGHYHCFIDNFVIIITQKTKDIFVIYKTGLYRIIERWLHLTESLDGWEIRLFVISVPIATVGYHERVTETGQWIG